MKKFFMLLVLATLGGLLLAPNPMAMAQEDDLQYSYGTVVAVTDQQLTLLEYDYDTDDLYEVNYIVDGSTKLVNINSLSELKEDDGIEIDFKQVEGNKIAVNVMKELVTEGEESTLEETINEDIPNEEENPPAEILEEPVANQL